MWIGRLCSQWRLSAVPSYSYQSRVQHSCTIHWCITSLLPNFRLGQTQFFSVQLYFVALFLLLCKCLKCLCSGASISEKPCRKPLGATQRRETRTSFFLYGMYCNIILFHLQHHVKQRSNVTSKSLAFRPHWFAAHLKHYFFVEGLSVFFSLRYHWNI